MDVDAAVKTMIDNMPSKTGKSLDEWKKVLAKKSFGKHSEAVAYLKNEHGVTHGFANSIVLLSKEEKNSDEDLIELQYKGKESLRSIYDQLFSEISSFGKDVEYAPKKAYVSVRRSKQFAIIQPSTKTRLDIGLVIKGKSAEGILEASGSFNAMCTHRIRVETGEKITAEMISYLKEAYNNA